MTLKVEHRFECVCVLIRSVVSVFEFSCIEIKFWLPCVMFPMPHPCGEQCCIILDYLPISDYFAEISLFFSCFSNSSLSVLLRMWNVIVRLKLKFCIMCDVTLCAQKHCKEGANHMVIGPLFVFCFFFRFPVKVWNGSYFHFLPSLFLSVSFPESFFVCQSVCRQQQGSLSADRRSTLPAES